MVDLFSMVVPRILIWIDSVLVTDCFFQCERNSLNSLERKQKALDKGLNTIIG